MCVCVCVCVCVCNLPRWHQWQVKNLPASLRDTRDGGWVLGLERSPRVGNGNRLKYSCLEDSMDRGDLQATVHGVMDMTEHTQHSIYTCIHIYTLQHTHTIYIYKSLSFSLSIYTVYSTQYYRKLTKLITRTTALSNSIKL